MNIPRLVEADQLALRPGEVFLATGGFEDRAVKFPEIVQPNATGSSRAIVLEYLPYDKKNRLDLICTMLSQKGFELRRELYNRHDPSDFDLRLKRTLIDLGTRSLCLDVSGMSRLAMMLVLDVARDMNLSVRIAFAEAMEYAPSQEEFEAARARGLQHRPTSFIDTGVYDVLRVPRFSSIRMQNHATLLVAFDSFNEALCQALINVINPSRFILINGRPPRDELRWREQATAELHRDLREEWSVEDDNEPIKTTSTLRYEETHALLVKLYWRFSRSHRIVVAPTGSKMQTLAAYLLRAVHDDVHIEYPTVEGFFSDKYSKDVRQTWVLDFGPMGKFVAHLRRMELREYLTLPERPVNVEIE